MSARLSSDTNSYPHEVKSLDAVVRRVSRRMDELARSKYFQLCRSGELTRGQLLRVIEQLYCFSTLFERILTRRLGTFTSRSPDALVQMARRHLQEEIGHAELFRGSLLRNGLTPDQIQRLTPTAHTKALFGYLLATLEYEHELVTNVAIMQVMELIGLRFFECSFSAMEQYGVEASALAAHAHDDQAHANLGLELCRELDERTLADAIRVIDDLFRLMASVLDEWVTISDSPEEAPALAVQSAPAKTNQDAFSLSDLRGHGAGVASTSTAAHLAPAVEL